jgi:hypothetical protein
MNEGLRTALISRPILLVTLGAVGAGLVLSCLFAILLLRPETTLDPTPTPFAQAEAVVPDDVIISSDTVTVSLSAPVSLEVGGRSYQVQPQVVTVDGVWAPAIAGEQTAVWIHGTIINYVLGLSDTVANRATIESLAPGDEIVLRGRDGAVHTFAFNSRRTVPATSRDIFDQTAPGITLVLVGARGQERLVAQGRYVVAETTPAEDPNVVELGETAQLNGLQLTVLSAMHQFERPEAPSGFAFYLIDFELQNVGTTILETGNLRLTLADHMGNQYALNPTASQVGNYMPVGGPLGPGQTARATAGYQIPAGLSSPTLRWVVTRLDTGSQAQVNIPFRGAAELGQQALVTLQQGEVSLDGTSLMLWGQITNLGDQPLVVQETNVSLISNGSFYLILSTNPRFPWIVAPGQTADFSLTFQRPSGDTAVFTVLNQPFQLTGLR